MGWQETGYYAETGVASFSLGILMRLQMMQINCMGVVNGTCETFSVKYSCSFFFEVAYSREEAGIITKSWLAPGPWKAHGRVGYCCWCSLWLSIKVKKSFVLFLKESRSVLCY